jgi:hypothetical protein
MPRILAALVIVLSSLGAWVHLASGNDSSDPREPLRAGLLYGVTVSARDLASVRGPVRVSVGDAQGIPIEKDLHAYDPDLTFALRARVDGPVRVEVAARPNDFEISVRQIAAAQVSETRSRWQDAQSIQLNQPLLASADERPYISLRGEYADLLRGQHWYRFTAAKDELGFFAVEAPDRDVPADIEVFRREGDALQPYAEGAHPYTPEATQNFPGLSNYRTRRLHAGETYYLRVSANHPVYRLRTATYPLPPYRDPRQAVRTAMDFAVSLGDAWLNNIPRRGSVATRDTLQHPETQNCVACHPTQFTSRSYLTAVRNGYEPVNRFAADALLHQLQNNPRPLPGHDGVTWSRMIFSARTISSRLPLLLQAASDLLPGATPAPFDIVKGSAGYLKMHYKGLDQLAEEEADGASPAVSPLEIALQSWQTYGLAGEDRASLEKQIAAYAPRTTIDFNWKIIALATIDRTRYRAEIDALVQDLLKRQGPDLRFDHADFITYHALYALAMAGLKPGDPRIDRLVDFTLQQQLESGGWQGEPGPKAFQTPFRDTQFAVMALSTLFPGKWKPTTAAVQPEVANSATALDRAYSIQHLHQGGTETLMPFLGDASKIVRIAAAERIRYSTPSPALKDQLMRALSSRDSRMRSGALHVFDKQFRAWAGDESLLTAVLSRLEDDAPLIRLQSAKALARWYTWNPSERILDRLAARLQIETELKVRRVLAEAVSGTLDENIGYAETWMRTMSDPADRQKTVDALHARSRAQARILAKHLDAGTRDGRLSLLEALWDLPVRHMAIPPENRERAEVVLPAYYAEFSSAVRDLHEGGFEYPPYKEALSFRYSATNGFHKTRVGNDSDLIDLSGAGPELEQSLLRLIRDRRDPELQIAAIKAGAALGNSMSRAFTTAILEALRTGDAPVRHAARYVYENGARGTLTLGDPDRYDPPFAAALAAALDAKHPDALAVALPLVANLPSGSTLSRDVTLMSKVDALLFAQPVHPRALAVASSFPRIADGPLMRTVMLESLTSADRSLRTAAAETAVKAYLADPTMPALAEQFTRVAKGETRRMMLDLLDPARLSLRLSALSLYNPGPGVSIPADASIFSAVKVQEFIAMALGDDDPDVRAAAQDLASLYPAVRNAPVVQEALRKHPAESRELDLAFFAAKVQPIFANPGADGKACVVCHATHGIFPLRIPSGKGGQFTEAQTRDNFRFAAAIVDRANPQKSLLLVKPTRPNDSAGDPNLYLATHNGGERWAGNESSEEYQTILRWIRGAKLR